MTINKVLIVGAGIGGLAAAAALGQRGVEVDVVEIRETATVLGVGINQPGNSLRALRELGVLDEVLAAGFTFDGNDYRDADDERIVLVPSSLGQDDVPANCGLTRKDLHAILLKAAESAGATIQYGAEVADFSEDADGVDATFSNGENGRYDLVVAFDGIRSPMRRRVLGQELVPSYTGSAVWRKQVPRPASVTRTMLWQGEGVKGGVIPLSETHMYMLLVTVEPSDVRHPEQDLAPLLKQRLSGFKGLLGDIRDSLDEDPDGIVYSPLVEMNVPLPWHRGRVIVLGDAVHAAVPHLTQGAAMAVEDAVVLADELQRDRPLEESLQVIEQLRHPRTELVFQASHGILAQEQTITAETLPFAIDGMRAHLAEQTAHVEAVLNQPFRALQHQ
ncbi:2-polyprenyl-6-methoxyphenol hydroxylase [Arthrobacter sp. 9AX]|uniref:FAD-dependent monooxygenase n=1 Tax=Arthrobacter sp. 9AX TaxID=2653131 RepID=UPI0012F39C16|nr:FAD-dependent monooxygenase [Arthrobacter sp. 9AX]VXC24479.1 2-polyprenyl-6-methoxyphenol hydroxylase [Arthrobacter sp. 9AX]